MMMRTKKQLGRGLTIIEVMVAIVVLAIAALV